MVGTAEHDEANDGARDILDCGPGMDTVYATGQHDIKGCEILHRQ